jgi:hypothetical protein
LDSQIAPLGTLKLTGLISADAGPLALGLSDGKARLRPSGVIQRVHPAARCRLAGQAPKSLPQHVPVEFTYRFGSVRDHRGAVIGTPLHWSRDFPPFSQTQTGRSIGGRTTAIAKRYGHSSATGLLGPAPRYLADDRLKRFGARQEDNVHA